MDDVPAGESTFLFILMPALLEIPTITIMHLCIFFLCDRYVTLGIRFGSCFRNLTPGVSNRKRLGKTMEVDKPVLLGKPLIEKKK